MSSKVHLTITSDSSDGTMTEKFSDSNPQTLLNKMQNYLSGVSGGAFASSLNIKFNEGDAVQASATLTCTSVAVNDTATVGNFEFTCVNKGQIDAITAVDDVSGSLNETYFTFTALDADGEEVPYYVWFNVDDTGADPEVEGMTGIEVAISEDDVAGTVALNASIEMAAVVEPYTRVTRSTSNIYVNPLFGGVDVTNAADGTGDGATGFSFVVTASDAMGDDEFQYQITDALQAASLADCINEHCSSLVTAEANSDVVTVTSVLYGDIGNHLIISATGDITASAFSGGSDDTTAEDYNFGR